jgi:diguanylate cyclase (GGDEF)-like protein
VSKKLDVLVVDYDARSRLNTHCAWAIVTTAASAQEAIALAQRRSFDIVVAAARLPGGSAVEVFSTLHRLKSTARFVVMRNGAYARERIPSGHRLASIDHPLDLGELAAVTDEDKAGSIPPSSKRAKVLIVDSDVAYAQRLATVLTQYRCHVASTIPEATAHLASLTYEAVVMAASSSVESVVTEAGDVPVICYSDDHGPRVAALQSGAFSFVTKANDISHIVDLSISQAQSARLMRDLALTDTRTGLKGWASFRAEIAQAMTRPRARFAVALLDLDHFKVVNDTYGHDTGDVLICEVAERIAQVARQVGGIPSRFAGDEFGVLFPDIEHADDALYRAERVLSHVRRPVDLGTVEWSPTCSIGVAVYPEHGSDVRSILEAADHTSYEAKRLGRNRVVLCNEEILLNIIQNREVSLNLTECVPTLQGFSLKYQPIVCQRSGSVTVETLLRWDPGCGHVIPPDVFVPILEKNGYIHEVGKWVLVRALQDFAQLRGRVRGLSVNVSTIQLMDPHFADFVVKMAEAYGTSNEELYLELTEGEKMSLGTNAHASLIKLSEAGFRWKLDDFGTGYASIRYLEELPFSVLKLDRTLIARGSKKYLKSVVEFAHTLDMIVIAEGVETIEQQELVRTAGVDAIQGYLLSKPLTLEELESWLAERELVRQ